MSKENAEYLIQAYENDNIEHAKFKIGLDPLTPVSCRRECGHFQLDAANLLRRVSSWLLTDARWQFLRRRGDIAAYRDQDARACYRKQNGPHLVPCGGFAWRKRSLVVTWCRRVSQRRVQTIYVWEGSRALCYTNVPFHWSGYISFFLCQGTLCLLSCLGIGHSDDYVTIAVFSLLNVRQSVVASVACSSVEWW